LQLRASSGLDDKIVGRISSRASQSTQCPAQQASELVSLQVAHAKERCLMLDGDNPAFKWVFGGEGNEYEEMLRFFNNARLESAFAVNFIASRAATVLEIVAVPPIGQACKPWRQKAERNGLGMRVLQRSTAARPVIAEQDYSLDCALLQELPRSIAIRRNNRFDLGV
jgi:hypothetical protein